jgi:protein SCO1
MFTKLIQVCTLSLFLACGSKSEEKLPYIGQKQVINGVEMPHTVGKINHYNQDSVLITNESMKDVIYVADFFFTSCPSICPKVMKEMIRIHDAVKDDPMVKLVTFTIDPKRDDVAKLNLYASNLGVKSDKWLFLTGDKDSTLDLADTYFVAALEDASAPGGFDHSGKIILVDKEGRVRSFSEGTDPSETPKIIKDIQTLKKEYNSPTH